MRTSSMTIALIATVLLDSSSATHAKERTAPSGPDVAGMDAKVHPGDDFFAYANGAWLKGTEIPADRSGWGVFAMMREEADKRTVALIQEAAKSNAAAGSIARKVGDYYDSFMDEEAIEKKGLAPLAAELAEIAAVADKAALARLLGAGLRADVDPLNATNFHTTRPFGLWVSPDLDDPARNTAYLLQGGLGMPDRQNYLATDDKNAALQAAYRAHIANVLKLAAIPGGEEKAARIYEHERKIAAVHATRTESLDVQKANNRWRLPEFATNAPGLDWNGYFKAAGLDGQPAIIVWHPAATKGIAALAGSEPLEVWKDYLTFRAIDGASSLLSKAFVEENFAFYGKTLSGAPQLRDRWKRAVAATNGALGEAVGKLYVDKHFSPEAKTVAQAMVKNIVAAFGRRVDALAWMSPATRAKAKAKLGTLYVGIGYPDRWRDYSALNVVRGDAFGNAQRAGLFDYRDSLARLGKAPDRTAWAMTPQTVNAVNLPLQNALNFPAAILNPPFFDMNADPAQNYGSIGAIIGHEISHSFDDMGSLFDAQGRLANWWTPEDMAHFRTAADRLVAQYGAYEPLPGLHVNGTLTLSENISDVAGISAAYDGYRSAVGAEAAAKVGGFTGDQRFFIAYGQAWRAKLRPEAMRSALITNSHAPSEYRADTVRNIDAWYQAFDIQPGRKLYLAPEARVRIW